MPTLRPNHRWWLRRTSQKHRSRSTMSSSCSTRAAWRYTRLSNICIHVSIIWVHVFLLFAYTSSYYYFHTHFPIICIHVFLLVTYTSFYCIHVFNLFAYTFFCCVRVFLIIVGHASIVCKSFYSRPTSQKDPSRSKMSFSCSTRAAWRYTRLSIICIHVCLLSPSLSINIGSCFYCLRVFLFVTNIAKTSIAIDDVVFVLVACRMKVASRPYTRLSITPVHALLFFVSLSFNIGLSF